MKKFFATTLAVTMAVATLGTTAFAEEATPTPTPSQTLDADYGYSYEIEVKGKYIEKLMSDEIISMDVEWGAMSFTYAATQQGTWNPETHDYDDSTEEAAWVGDTTSEIKVTNHSNVGVTASFKFEAQEEFKSETSEQNDGVTGTFTQDSVELEKGEVKDEEHPNAVEEADSKTVTFTIGGKLKNTATTETQIGTITVSVEKTKTTTSDGE